MGFRPFFCAAVAAVFCARRCAAVHCSFCFRRFHPFYRCSWYLVLAVSGSFLPAFPTPRARCSQSLVPAFSGPVSRLPLLDPAVRRLLFLPPDSLDLCSPLHCSFLGFPPQRRLSPLVWGPPHPSPPTISSAHPFRSSPSLIPFAHPLRPSPSSISFAHPSCPSSPSILSVHLLCPSPLPILPVHLLRPPHHAVRCLALVEPAAWRC